MEAHYSVWFSCNGFTIRIYTAKYGVITDAAPIARRFIGQHISKLYRWADYKFGDVIMFTDPIK